MKTIEGLNEVLTGKRMSESSKSNYEDVFRSVGKLYDELPLKKVEINKWLVSLEGYADTTVRLWFTLLRSAYEYLEGNCDVFIGDVKNPFIGLKSPRIKKHKRRYYRPGEIAKILTACRDDYEFALVATLIDSTCRIGELAGLGVKDVGDSWIDVKGKTGEKRYRLDSRLCELLKRLGDSDGGTIFRLNGSALSTRIIRICKRAGLTGSKLGPHTLRHSSASLVASETKNVMAVKALLQHDNIQTSMLYIHDVEEELQKGISPLALVVDRVKADVGLEQKQLPMVGSPDGEAVVVEGEAVDVVDDLALEMFRDVSDGVVVRPLLKTEDLRLIREALVGLARNDGYSRDVSKAIGLWKRMLRRVK